MTTPDDSADALLSILRQAVVGLVKRDGPDLSARQLTIFLVCYAEDEAQTVRGLAKQLNISKAAVSRGLDRLMEFDLMGARAIRSTDAAFSSSGPRPGTACCGS